ncbi:MAG TPA: hypothetical protein VGB46_05220 [Flavisolibacter sp.]|jgi:hypothetical protein
MKTWSHIQDELKELKSSLSTEKVQEAYSVPQGYFEQFAASVLERIKLEELDEGQELENLSPLLASIPRKMPFSVPAGYFDSSASSLPAFTSQEELPEILASLKGSNPYSVPQGYFESLSDQVLSRVNQPRGRVVSMTTRWMRVAAAAMVGGIIAISGYFYFAGRQQATPAPDVNNPQWVAQKLKNVENQELEEFIKSTDVSAKTPEPSRKPSANDEVKALLKDVSVQEMESFLNQLPMEEDPMLMN